jgi:hypothetical protein
MINGDIVVAVVVDSVSEQLKAYTMACAIITPRVFP